jgi:hypothetical protein
MKRLSELASRFVLKLNMHVQGTDLSREFSDTFADDISVMKVPLREKTGAITSVVA